MTNAAPASGHQQNRASWIALSGWFIIILSAGTALLPAFGASQGALIIGGLLILAGAVEIFSGRLRHQTRKLAMLAGGITATAGLLFATEPATKFMPTLFIIAGWLFLRSIILAIAAFMEIGSVQFWTASSAIADFLLATLLAIGISISTLIVTLFGPTAPLIAHFSWILAASFVVTGLMLLEVAKCARTEED